jgi:hypothetical protein
VPAPVVKEQLIALLVRAFSPYVGATMAGASARGVCERLAPDRSTIDHAGVTAILAELEPGLHVYIGKEKTDQVVRELWAAIRALGGSP